MHKLAMMFVVLALAGCANAGAQMQLRAAPVEPVSLTPQQLQTVDSTIRGIMKDPDSAKFKNIVSSRRDGTVYVCGSVNAKNSFGGYVGFSPFRVDIEEATGFAKIMSSPNVNGDFIDHDMSKAMCTAVGLYVEA